jgi:hypothetical protein
MRDLTLWSSDRFLSSIRIATFHLWSIRLACGHVWEGKVIFISAVWQKGQLVIPSSNFENVLLLFTHDVAHGGSFETPSALATGKTVGYTRSSTNCQQMAQGGCSPLTVLAAYMRIPIPATIHYPDQTCGNGRSSAASHCFSISARLLATEGCRDLPLM